MAVTLIKVDRNGTKYYQSDDCPKCGGKGYLYCYGHIEGGVCFKCGGTGKGSQTWKEYTPEYAQKLADRRAARAQAKSGENRAKFLEKEGFGADGFTYVIKGNTYSIKDELKAAGAKFNSYLGWHFANKDNGYDCFEINADDVAEFNSDWAFRWKDMEIVEHLLGELKEEENRANSVSQHLFSVGEKVTVSVTLSHIASFGTQFGTTCIFNFTDDDGNILVWKTATYQELEEGNRYVVKGTVKSHDEYKGIKQTTLTRCKVSA